MSVSVRRALIPLALLVALAGCSSEPAGPAASDPLAGPELTRAYRRGPDAALRELIESHADGAGLAGFILPDARHLDRIPQDPKNPITREKARLGRFLYHETALAVNNLRPEGRETYSCAACHHAQGGFQANLPQGFAEGAAGFGESGEMRTVMAAYMTAPDFPDCQPIRSPSAMNTAYQELMLWNGQFGGVGENFGTEDKWKEGTPLESNHLGMHGLETQAHAGLAVHRMGEIEVSRVAEIPRYRAMFRRAFPGETRPINRLNAALAIAAYERTLLASEAPFQRWLRGKRHAMTPRQKSGAMLFFGKADCASCHTGPALSSMTFHALGMNDLDGAYDARVVLLPFGDTVPDNVRRGRGGFTGDEADMYAFKTPQLYNLLDSPFYGHGASFATVREVVEYKNTGVPQNPLVPADRVSPEFQPLGLSPREVADLTAFVEEALYDANLERYLPRRLPSGNCFPVNDPVSREDLGCGDRVVAWMSD